MFTDASRIDLLRSENQVLKNRLSPTANKFISDDKKTDHWSEARRHKPSSIFGRNSTVYQNPFGHQSDPRYSSEEEDCEDDKTLSDGEESDYDKDETEKDLNTMEEHILKDVSGKCMPCAQKNSNNKTDITITMSALAEHNIDNLLERRQARLGQNSDKVERAQ